jgi:predicted ATP-dependent endonuclease of OLD family
MRLIEVTVHKYRNILDSNPVKIEKDITCLVGKNEAGKSAFLYALYSMNPVRQNVKLKPEDHYPAWLEKKDRLKGIDLNKEIPIRTRFQLDNEEKEIIESTFGDNVLCEDSILLFRTYKGDQNVLLKVDEKQFVKNLISGLSFTQGTRTILNKCSSSEEVLEFLSNFKVPEDTTDKEKESIKELQNRISIKIGENDSLQDAVFSSIKDYVPGFIYFSTYSTLPYTVKIKEVLTADESSLNDELLTARSLLRIAGTDDDYILNPDYERRKRELENVANALTQDVLNYWSQNDALRVNPDITLKTVNQPNGQTSVIDELKIRIWDDKHFLSLPFNEHSTGFQWFFSFLAAFSEFEYSDDPVIILLDEPGLGLHGKAQADFIRFIEERLAKKCQVIYSTHSPFMVQPDKLERVRIVEEKGRTEGAKITDDVLTTDSDTLFPLQGALGYDLAQHLFISKHNLVLEGTSDFTYISLISDHLHDKGRIGLKPEWTLVPVGGADMIPTFVALLGIHLDLTVVVDSRKEGNQKLSHLARKGYLKTKRIVTLNEITGSKLADIEDLFDPADYLNLYNDAFGKSIEISHLTGSDQIVNQLARYAGIDRFDHGKPASVFLRNRDKHLKDLSESSLSNFERLFDRINKTFAS